MTNNEKTIAHFEEMIEAEGIEDFTFTPEFFTDLKDDFDQSGEGIWEFVVNAEINAKDFIEILKKGIK